MYTNKEMFMCVIVKLCPRIYPTVDGAKPGSVDNSVKRWKKYYIMPVIHFRRVNGEPGFSEKNNKQVQTSIHK